VFSADETQVAESTLRDGQHHQGNEIKTTLRVLYCMSQNGPDQ